MKTVADQVKQLVDSYSQPINFERVQDLIRIGKLIDAQAVGTLDVDLTKLKADTERLYRAVLESKNGDSRYVAQAFADYSKQIQTNKRVLNNLSDALLTEISKYREFGGELNLTGSKVSQAGFQASAKYFPTDWIDASNKYSEETGVALMSHLAPQRAGYKSLHQKRTTTKGKTYKTIAIENLSGVYTEALAGGAGQADAEQALIQSIQTHYQYFEPTHSIELHRADNKVDLTKCTVRFYACNPLMNTWRHPKGATQPPSTRYKKYSYTDVNGNTQSVWRRPLNAMPGATSYEMVAKITTGSCYSSQGKKVAIQTDCTHELTHRFEHTNAPIGKAEYLLLHERTKDMQTKQIPGSPRGEYGYTEAFVIPYMGRIYGGTTSFEIMSTAMEALFHGQFGGLLGLPTDSLLVGEERLYDKQTQTMRADEDMRAFAIGVLVAV